MKNKIVEKDLDRLHAIATIDEPHKGPHISAHNVIKVIGDDKYVAKMQIKTHELERNYQKSVGGCGGGSGFGGGAGGCGGGGGGGGGGC